VWHSEPYAPALPWGRLFILWHPAVAAASASPGKDAIGNSLFPLVTTVNPRLLGGNPEVVIADEISPGCQITANDRINIGHVDGHRQDRNQGGEFLQDGHGFVGVGAFANGVVQFTIGYDGDGS
jgi:hypothetical protein